MRAGIMIVLMLVLVASLVSESEANWLRRVARTRCTIGVGGVSCTGKRGVAATGEMDRSLEDILNQMMTEDE